MIPRLESMPGLLAAVPRRENDSCTECWYCGASLGPRHEHDHLFPRRHGGNGPVAPACRGCHDLKDRTPLGAWPTEVYVKAMLGCSIDGHARLMLAKLMAIALDMEKTLAGEVES